MLGLVVFFIQNKDVLISHMAINNSISFILQIWCVCGYFIISI